VTPEEAREIDRLEFDAECRAVRERVFARIAERHGAERARVLRWMENELPRGSLQPRWTLKPAALTPPTPPPTVKKPRKPRSGPQRIAFGVSRTLREWADHLGISVNTLHQRIHKTGSLEDAIRIGGLKNTGRRLGVVANFPEPIGTGGGPIAQDIPEIEFSK
jgi:hypothetical protein